MGDVRTGGERALVRLDRVLAVVEDATALLSGLTIFGLMLFAIANIALRKIFNMPIFGYIDVVEISMIVFAVGAVAYCQRLGGHVRMELILGTLKGRALWISEMVATLVAIVIIAVLINYSWDYFLNAYVNGDSTIDAELPTWPAKLVVPIALTVLLARLGLQLWGYFRLVQDPDRAPLSVPVIENVEEHARQEIEDAGISVDEG